jgi:hypothetical protein
MATVGAKNQPLTATTDLFQPNIDINTVSNWVANNYASVKILTGATLHTAVTGADLFQGLTVYESSTDQFWTYNGTAWYLQPLGSTFPRFEGTLSTGTVSIPNAAYTNLGSSTASTAFTTSTTRGGMTYASTTGIVTVPYAGRYNIWAFSSWTANATGFRALQLLIGGTALYGNAITSVSSTIQTQNSLNIQGITLTASQTLQLQAYQNSTAALTISAAAYPVKFIVEYAGQ